MVFVIVLIFSITTGSTLQSDRSLDKVATVMDEEKWQHLGVELKDATRNGNIKKVKQLLKQGADVNWKDVVQWTALHRACYGSPGIVKVLLKSSLNINLQTSVGDTPLHHACACGSLDCVKLLLATGQCDTGIVNNDRRTPLEVAVAMGNQDVVKYFHSVDVNKPGLVGRVLEQAVCKADVDFIKYVVLEQGVGEPSLMRSMLELAVRESDLDLIEHFVTKQRMDVNGPVTETGNTPIEVAVCEGKLDVIKYLVHQRSVDIKGPVTRNGETLLGLAVREGKLEIIKYLVTMQSVDVNGPVTKSGNTSIEVAIHEGKLDVIKYLVHKQRVGINEQHLFLACEHQQAEVVKYLLTTYHMNPNTEDNSGRTPLSLAKNKDVIKLLIQHGADAENVYALHRKVLNNVFSKDPVKSPVKMFVIGHGGEGKSTLIQAMEHEPTFWTSVVDIFIAPKEVDGVDQRTAGIIPRVFKSRFYGDVQFYDFAGQEAYYSSHAAVIRSAVNACPPVFLLVIGLHRGDSAIMHSITYWLGIITNQCANMEGKAPLIIVGSHADLVNDEAEIERIKHKISLSIQKFLAFQLVDTIALDCRYSNSIGMKLLRQRVEASCSAIRTRLSVNLNSHMFLIYLVDNYSNELAVLLQSVKDKLEASAQDPSKDDDKVVSFIPTTIPRLIEICIQLSDKGHILFLHNETSPEESFIVIDKTALLAEVNGTMFAPEDFKQHCQLSTSTGVVPNSELAKHFSKFDINMLIRFLSHLELAVPIEDDEILKLIDGHLAKAGTSDTAYLFCPALIRLEVPPNVFLYQTDRLYRFGWLLSCISVNDFFDARFLHVLLLRLALSLGLAPIINPDFPALQRQCSVWKTGVHWNTPQGAEILVEVVNKKKVIVLVQDRKPSLHVLQLQSKIIRKVLKTANEFCPSVNPQELLLFPIRLVYPLSISDATTLFSIKSLAKSIVEQDPFVISTNGTEQTCVNEYEVYANLGENILQAFFNESDQVHTKRISDRFLSAISSSWSKNPQLVDIICSAITPTTDMFSQYVAGVDKMKAALKSWRDGSDGTYKSLRQILDQLSVFAGKSPLELAGFQYKDFEENKLPAVETVSQPTIATLLAGVFAGLKNCEKVSEHSSTDLVVEELKKEYGVNDDQLNTKIRVEDLYDLAGCFDCVETYLDKLGLTAGQQRQVEDLAERRDVQTAMIKALKFWRQPKPWLATFRTLLNILLDLKRGDVAVRICHYIRQEVPKHKMK